MPKVHRSVTTERVLALAEENMFGLTNTGICLACGTERDGCEPDARRYPCDACGKRAVYGAEEVMMMGAHHATA